MELKQYFQIIKKNIKLFILIVVLAVVATLAYFYFRPVSYSTSLTLNITRSGTQNTSDYKYDGFYRIQADDKFAETVVEWLKSPRIASDIYKEAGINLQHFNLKKLSRSVRPEKLSSQVISVTYASSNKKAAQDLAQAVSKVVSQNVQNLNKDQKEEAWFEVVAHEPVIVKDVYNPLIIFLIALGAGIFLAFWAILIKHYLE